MLFFGASSSLHFSVCLCFIFSEIFCFLSILVQCPFLEVLAEAGTPPLPSQQGSSINKKAAPHCTIMAKNKLLGLSSCFHSFNTIYLMTCLCVYMTVCRCVCLCCLSLLLHICTCVVHVFFMCFISSVGIASVLCLTSQSKHHSASLSATLRDRVLGCVSLSAASSASIVSPIECCIRQPLG